MGKRLKPFQEVTLKKLQSKIAQDVKHRGFGVFWDTGLGKTALISSLASSDGSKFLIVIPASLKEQWVDELTKWGNSPEDIHVIRNGKDKKFDKRIVLVSYSLFRTIFKDEELAKEVLRNRILVFDEISKLKNSKAKVTEVAKKVSKYAYYRIGLTATPYETSPYNIWNIMMVLNIYKMKHSEFRNCLKYETVYAPQIGDLIEIPVGFTEEGLKVITERLKYNSERLTKEEVREQLPPIEFVNRFVKPTKVQEELAKKIINASFDDTTGMHNIFKVFTLLRLLDNGIEELKESESEYVPEIKEVKNDTNKLNELLEVLEELKGQGQVLIFTQFLRSAKRIYKVLKENGWNSVEMTHGGDGEKDRKIREFKEGKFDILITTETLNYGISFDNVDYEINYDIHPNFARMVQRFGRIHRLGSKNGKVVINLIGGIVERRIHEIMKERKITFEDLTENMISEREVAERVIDMLVKNKRR